MLVRWVLLAAVWLGAASAEQQNDLSGIQWVGRPLDPDLPEARDYLTEDDLDDEQLNQLAELISDSIEPPDGKYDHRSRALSFKGFFKGVSKGLIKGGKKAGKIVLSAGKKLIKVSAKGVKIAGKGMGKGFIKIGKGMGKGIIKLGKGASKGLMKGAKGLKKMVTKKGAKVWESLKKKFKNQVKKAGKKLIKKVGQKILEKGFEMAVEAIAPMVIEYVMEKTQEGLCGCVNTTCSCCAQPPGFEKGCLVMKIRPRLKMITSAITYNGKELSRINVTLTEEGADSLCARLPGIASFMKACIQPLGIGEIEGGFRGCLALGLDPLSLQREMCVDFTGTAKDPSARFLLPSELDEIDEGTEVVVEQQ